VSCAGNVNKGTLGKLADRGTVKTIPGVHAKVYIFDKRAILTSANLTETAFTRRREIGILLDEHEANQAIELFADWWDHHTAPIDQSQLPTWKKKGGQNDAESEGQDLLKLWDLPPAPPESEFEQSGGGAQAAFSRYQGFLKCYEELAQVYEANQRLWPKGSRYMEVDSFLNFLYHDAPGIPSREFRGTIRARELTRKQRVEEVAKWAVAFSRSASFERDFGWRAKHIAKVQSILGKNMISKLTWESAREVADCINAMNAYPINKARFLNPKNNSLNTIRQSWNRLLHGTDPEQDRIDKCNAELKFFGTSSLQELLGWFYPTKYPLKNANSDAGLRFFGFHF